MKGNIERQIEIPTSRIECEEDDLSELLLIYKLGWVAAVLVLLTKAAIILLTDFFSGLFVYRANLKKIGTGYSYLTGQYVPLADAKSDLEKVCLNWIISTSLSWITVVTEIPIIVKLILNALRAPFSTGQSDRMKELHFSLFRTSSLPPESVWARVMAYEVLLGLHRKPGEIHQKLDFAADAVSSFDKEDALRQLRCLNCPEIDKILGPDSKAS